MLKTPLKSIDEEFDECQLAFELCPGAKFGWCIHHEGLIERIAESIGNRFRYVLNYKSENEQARRFRNMLPVRIALPDSINLALAAFESRREEGDALGIVFREKKYVFDQKKSDDEYDSTALAEEAMNKACDEMTTAYNSYSRASDAFTATYSQLLHELHLCREVLTKLHDEDWPDNSWNGGSIFNE